jgi:hypothetical protein
MENQGNQCKSIDKHVKSMKPMKTNANPKQKARNPTQIQCKSQNSRTARPEIKKNFGKTRQIQQKTQIFEGMLAMPPTQAFKSLVFVAFSWCVFCDFWRSCSGIVEFYLKKQTINHKKLQENQKTTKTCIRRHAGNVARPSLKFFGFVVFVGYPEPFWISGLDVLELL